MIVEECRVLRLLLDMRTSRSHRLHLWNKHIHTHICQFSKSFITCVSSYILIIAMPLSRNENLLSYCFKRTFVDLFCSRLIVTIQRRIRKLQQQWQHCPVRGRLKAKQTILIQLVKSGNDAQQYTRAVW